MRLKKARGKKWRFCQKHEGKEMATLKKCMKYKFGTRWFIVIIQTENQ